MYSVICVFIYAEAAEDSTKDEKTETEQPAERQMKEGPSSSEKVDKICKHLQETIQHSDIPTQVCITKFWPPFD